MSKLILIRHAKSDWSGYINVLQRGLNKRGYNSCKVISEELKKRIDKPDLFLISPALRAQLTYENIFLNWDNKNNFLSIEEDLYHASIDQIKKKLTSKVLGFSTVVVIGHNPILNSLMYQLSTKGYNKLPVNLVTCGVVIIEYSENNFKPPVFTNGEVIDYFFPRMYM